MQIDIRKFRKYDIDHNGYPFSYQFNRSQHKANLARFLQESDKGTWDEFLDDLFQQIENTYPDNATDNEKQKILDKYHFDFSGVEFENDLDCRSFSFPLTTFFSDTTFKGGVSFESVNFLEESLFMRSIFFENTNFFSVYFSKNTNFSDVEFLGKADFGYVNFSGEASFKEATFSGNASFSKTTFSGEANFNATKFNDNVSFVDLTIQDKTYNQPFDFRDATFKNKPLITSIPSDLKKFKELNKDNNYKEDSERFMILKQLAEANNNHIKSLEFNACELYCKQKSEPVLKTRMHWLYGLFSVYGLSIYKPIVFLLLFMIMGLGIQFYLDKDIDYHKNINFGDKVHFYIAPSLPPLISDARYQESLRKFIYKSNNSKIENIKKTNSPKEDEVKSDKTNVTNLSKNNEAKSDKTTNSINSESITSEHIKMPPLNSIVRGIQALLSYIMYFLIGLAIRNRFKL